MPCTTLANRFFDPSTSSMRKVDDGEEKKEKKRKEKKRKKEREEERKKEKLQKYKYEKQKGHGLTQKEKRPWPTVIKIKRPSHCRPIDRNGRG